MGASCGTREMDASAPGQAGDPCSLGAQDDEADPCDEGFACEPVGHTEERVCAAPIELRGFVYDSLTGDAIEGAHVSALDETGAPVADVAVTDVDGQYVLRVSARRDDEGNIAENLRWTLFSTASDYLPFPAGVRPAIPVNAADAMPEGDEENPLDVIENATTEIALLRLHDAERGGATISGRIEGELAPGTLVVAEGGPGRAPYAIADASGNYTLFNVLGQNVTIRGYRAGLELEPVSVSVSQDHHDAVDLPLVSEDSSELGYVRGSVNIVNAEGGLTTSVVLVPVSVYNENLERGPVPFGLRAPGPPEAPSVSSAFEIPGVPSGSYMVLSAFENDRLVRDPDASIAGTSIPRIEVAMGQDLGMSESFKITEELAIVGPGFDAPEVIDGPLELVWSDDSSEDRYEVEVFDAMGELVWDDRSIPGVSGGDDVRVRYDGPAEPGMYYQFRVTSFRDTPQGSFAISRTEDLRGVFVFADPSATSH